MSAEDIAICSMCLTTFPPHEDIHLHKCLQVKVEQNEIKANKQLDICDQEDFFKNNSKRKRISKQTQPNMLESDSTTCSVCLLSFESIELLSLHSCVEIKEETTEENPFSNFEVMKNNSNSDVKFEDENNVFENTFTKEINSFGSMSGPEKKQRKIDIMTISYDCSQCPAKFKRTSYLQEHIQNSHKKYRDSFLYDCTICPAKFSKNCHLTEHFANVHSQKEAAGITISEILEEEEELKKYKCPTCNKRFQQENSFKHHVETQHKKLEPSPPPSLPFSNYDLFYYLYSRGKRPCKNDRQILIDTVLAFHNVSHDDLSKSSIEKLRKAIEGYKKMMYPMWQKNRPKYGLNNPKFKGKWIYETFKWTPELHSGAF